MAQPIITTFIVIIGLVLGQSAPAMATYWYNYYSTTTGPGTLRSGYVGIIYGGSAELVVGTSASVYIRTYGPDGGLKAQGTAVGTGPTSISHGAYFDGRSKCMWTGGGSNPGTRVLKCKDLRGP